LRKPYTVLSIGASYQMFVHLATVFQRRRFLNGSRQNEQVKRTNNDLQNIHIKLKIE
jgi:hypothetical protein